MGRGYHSNNVARNNEFIWKDQTGGLSLDDKWHCALCKKTIYFKDHWELTHIKRFNCDRKKNRHYDHRGKTHLSSLKIQSKKLFKKEYYDQKNFYGLEIKCRSCNMKEIKMHRLGINYNPLTHNVCVMKGCSFNKKPQKKEIFSTSSYCKDCVKKIDKETFTVAKNIRQTVSEKYTTFEYRKDLKNLKISKNFKTLKSALDFSEKVEKIIEKNQRKSLEEIKKIKTD